MCIIIEQDFTAVKLQLSVQSPCSTHLDQLLLVACQSDEAFECVGYSLQPTGATLRHGKILSFVRFEVFTAVTEEYRLLGYKNLTLRLSYRAQPVNAM
jgi:hypothetical protein